MSEKKVLRRDFGEFLEAPKKDPSEKTRYYIKVTAKKEILDLIKENTILELEAPDEKYKRMLASNKLTEQQKESAQKSMQKIPKFFVKRVVAKIK
jgi:regulator of replication initiation timing